MATRTTRSQTRTIGAAPSVASSASPRYNPLNAFRSNQQGPKLVDQFQSFSACRTTPSASQPPPSQESPTLGAHIVVIPDYDGSETQQVSSLVAPPSMMTMMPEIQTSPEAIPQIRPLMMKDLYPDDSDKETKVEHIPLNMLIQLASAIQSLTHSSHCPSSDPTPCTKVQEPDQFDGTDLQKLWVFLVQLELHFQDRAKAFRMV